MYTCTVLYTVLTQPGAGTTRKAAFIVSIKPGSPGLFSRGIDTPSADLYSPMRPHPRARAYACMQDIGAIEFRLIRRGCAIGRSKGQK